MFSTFCSLHLRLKAKPRAVIPRTQQGIRGYNVTLQSRCAYANRPAFILHPCFCFVKAICVAYGECVRIFGQVRDRYKCNVDKPASMVFIQDAHWLRRFWLSVLLSLTIECRTQLRPKRFKAAVGTSIARPVRHGRTICRRQIQHGCHNTSVWIVCSCKRRLLRKRGRAMLVPTAFLLS